MLCYVMLCINVWIFDTSYAVQFSSSVVMLHLLCLRELHVLQTASICVSQYKVTSEIWAHVQNTLNCVIVFCSDAIKQVFRLS